MNQPTTLDPRTTASGVSPRRWTFRNQRSSFARTLELWLVPELHLDPCVDDVWDASPAAQLAYYVNQVRLRSPDEWEADAVHICWSVQGEGVCETAPFAGHDVPWGDFLAHFTWPEDAATGERVDWFALPVRYDRWPGLAEALGCWRPSPLQRAFPLRSLVECMRARGTL